MTLREFGNLVFANLNVLGQGETMDATLSADLLTRANNWIDALGTERQTIYYTARNPYTLTANDQTYTIGSSGNFNQERPLWIPFASVIPTGDNPVEIPVAVLTLKDWALKSIKGSGVISGQSFTSTFPTELYYDYAWSSGLGQIIVWPMPTTACVLVLYTPVALTEFADLDTDYTFPPGYRRFIETNLTIELAVPYGRAVSDDMMQRAVEAKAQIKRANARLIDASVDPATLSRGLGGYNWRSDSMGYGR